MGFCALLMDQGCDKESADLVELQACMSIGFMLVVTPGRIQKVEPE